MATSTKKTNGSKPKAAAKKTVSRIVPGGGKPKSGSVTYLLPVNPAMVKLSADQLVAHGALGAEQAKDAGLELLRRKTNRANKKQQA